MMSKVLAFPKREYSIYLKALSCYRKQAYQMAIYYFKQIDHLPYFKKLILNPLFDAYLQIGAYREIYDWLEDNFLVNALDEDDLIDKYIYTLLHDQRARQAEALIQVMMESQELTPKFKRKLRKYQWITKEILRKEAIEKRMEIFAYAYQNQQVNLLINLDQLVFDENQDVLLALLQDAKADPLIKYQILLYLKERNYQDTIEYVNSFQDTFIISLDHFTAYEQDERFFLPPKLVHQQLLTTHPHLIIDLSFIENIWLNDYLALFPKQEGLNQLVEQLKAKILYIIDPRETKFQELDNQ